MLFWISSSCKVVDSSIIIIKRQREFPTMRRLESFPLFSVHPIGMDLWFEISHCTIFCLLLPDTSFFVATFEFSPITAMLWSFPFASVCRESPSFFRHKTPLFYHLSLPQAPRYHHRLPFSQKTHTESTLS